MLVCAFGPPSALTYWSLDVIRSIVRVAIGDDVHIISANRIEELREAWSGRNNRKVMLFSDCLEVPVSDLIINCNIPFVIFADDSRNMLRHLKMERKLDLESATRLASQCISAMADMYSAEHAFIFGISHYSFELSAYVRELGSALDIPLSDQHVSSILDELVGQTWQKNYSTVFDELTARWPYLQEPSGADEHNNRENEDADLINQYTNVYFKKKLDLVEWPKSLFLTVGGASHSTTIDLVGPARYLTFGPYMHLPRGNWIAQVEIEVANNKSGNTIVADVVHGEVQTVVSAALPSHSVYQFELAFEVTEPLKPVEVRIAILLGAIEGKFMLRKVRIIRDVTKSLDLAQTTLDRPIEMGATV